MMTRSTHRARSTALGGVLALTLSLAACGADDDTASSDNPSSSSSPTPASRSHNDADVAFATGMVPHHGQAIAMAAIAETRASSPQLRELAADIKSAQGPEIVQMSGWLAGWGEDVPDPDSMAMGTGHDMGDMNGSEDGDSTEEPDDGSIDPDGMAGMMSAEDMARLMAASGTTFDRLWLNGMVAHHEGAVEMSKVELADGANPDARKLARAIIDAQRAEIATMRSLLAS